FQQEDGIGDGSVPGVQPCALPIPPPPPPGSTASARRPPARSPVSSALMAASSAPASLPAPSAPSRFFIQLPAPSPTIGGERSERSEERRGGKEGRDRG